MLNIAQYTIHDTLYESRQSLVYRGISVDDRPVVLKILRREYPTPEEIARFRREFEITAELQIEGVIKTFALEPYQNSLMMVLEDFGAESLTRLSYTDGFSPHPDPLPKGDVSPLPLGEGPGVRFLSSAEFLRLAIRITKIVGEIHRHNMIHKDINPSNIIWNRETDQIKIIDFGISTVLPRETVAYTAPNALEGTLPYISPEQTGRMNRAIDYRTDFYSLGVMFYKLLTGQLPFGTKDPLELVHAHLAKIPVPRSNYTPHSPLEGGLRGVFFLEGGLRGVSPKFCLTSS